MEDVCHSGDRLEGPRPRIGVGLAEMSVTVALYAAGGG